MKIIERGNRYYPKSLLDIFNPPKKLYVMGDEKILNEFSIGIVGSRKCTKYGENIAKSLSYNLAKYGINTISGMAKGIDTAAHVGTIMGEGKTIAVLRRRIWSHISKREREID